MEIDGRQKGWNPHEFDTEVLEPDWEQLKLKLDCNPRATNAPGLYECPGNIRKIEL